MCVLDASTSLHQWRTLGNKRSQAPNCTRHYQWSHPRPWWPASYPRRSAGILGWNMGWQSSLWWLAVLPKAIQGSHCQPSGDCSKVSLIDDEALAKDLGRHPPPARNLKGQLRWEGSDAQQYLKEDIENEKHKYVGYTPRHFRTMRPCYLLFDLDVFRKHIDQSKQTRKEFGKTPGQAAAKKNHRKVGGKTYKRRAEEEE